VTTKHRQKYRIITNFMTSLAEHRLDSFRVSYLTMLSVLRLYRVNLASWPSTLTVAKWVLINQLHMIFSFYGERKH
jgi:hypothetical protein